VSFDWDDKLPNPREHEIRHQRLNRDAFTATVRGAAAGLLLLGLLAAPLVYASLSYAERLQ